MTALRAHRRGGPKVLVVVHAPVPVPASGEVLVSVRAAAEFVTVPAADLAAEPSTVSHTRAAALPLAGLTAPQALVDHAAVQPGRRSWCTAGPGESVP
jgi:NADPH:quinone reductase-like Zn-dependent oxidoreductase